MSRKVIFKTLANLTVFLHLVVMLAIMAALVGAGSLTKYPILHRIGTALIVTTMISILLFSGCPLTTLENAFRQQYSPETKYYGSFVVHMLLKYTGIKVPTILVTTATFLIVALAGIVWYAHAK
jgi:hypothetical protein